MKILVTGGMGFIGSNIVDEAVGQGHEVISIDDMSSGKIEHANPKAPNYDVDITDEDALDKIFNSFRPEVVIHTAGFARIQPSFENPDKVFQVNVVGTRNILMLSKKYGVRRVVYSASSSAYGDQPEPKLRESMWIPPQALHPYGSTKRMGEMLMRDMGKVTGGPETVCLRYFNVYGPRQTTTADGPHATVVGIFLSQLAAGKPLTIVPDGDQKRDFTWVGDVVNANLLSAVSDKVGEGEIINIGSGENHSIWKVAKLILGESEGTSADELLKSGKCVMAPPRRGEIRETLADITLAKKLIGWEPKMNFDAGIKILKRNVDNS